VERGGADGGKQGAGCVAGGLAGIGDVRQALGESCEIEAGAAAEDGKAAGVVGVGDGGEGFGAPPGSAAWLRGRADAVEGMRYAGFF
jgi:hypothetical protein